MADAWSQCWWSFASTILSGVVAAASLAIASTTFTFSDETWFPSLSTSGGSRGIAYRFSPSGGGSDLSSSSMR